GPRIGGEAQIRFADAQLEHVPFISIQTFVMSTASICGTAGLPLPSGERVGVRGTQPLDRKPPHPTPLPSGEREQAVLAAYPWLHSTETCFSPRGRYAAFAGAFRSFPTLRERITSPSLPSALMSRTKSRTASRARISCG